MTPTEDVVLAASRLLVKYGTKTPDWDEWRDLKNALLKIHPSLKGNAKEQVGQACSTFNLELSKVLKRDRLKDEEFLDDC